MRISDWSSDVCSSDLLGTHLLQLFQATAVVQPRLVGIGPHSTRETRKNCIRRVLVDKVAGGRMPRLDDTVLDGIKNLQRRHDTTCAKRLDLDPRSEERRGGTEGVSTWRSRWWQ